LYLLPLVVDLERLHFCSTLLTMISKCLSSSILAYSSCLTCVPDVNCFFFVLFCYRNVVSTWSSGTGGSGLFGALSFAALTTAGLSARKTVLLMLVIPALMAITFFFILDHEKRRVKTNDRFLSFSSNL
jgi:battenin